jgi:hypothetical protein
MAAITTPTVLNGETSSQFPDPENIKKILYPGNLDPLIDPTVIRPESAYEIVQT